MTSRGSTSIGTIGQFIESVVLKEFYLVQINRGRQNQNLDPDGVRSLLARIAPTLGQDVLETVAGWIPVAAEVTSESLLPDLDRFPTTTHNAQGLSVQQKKLVLEAVEIMLDTFNHAEVTGLDAHDVPLLPRPCIACISAQVVSMLEHLALVRGRGTAVALHDNDLDLATWQRVCNTSREQPQKGSREELVEELQQCRQRIFELEKELAMQANSAAGSAARAKREHGQMATRLLNVNHALELKNKMQSNEAKALREQVSELQVRLAHDHWRAGQKDKETLALEEQLARQMRLQDDMLVREKEYGRRILNLHLKEFESTCRNDQRMRTLSRVMSTGGQSSRRHSGNSLVSRQHSRQHSPASDTSEMPDRAERLQRSQSSERPATSQSNEKPARPHSTESQSKERTTERSELTETYLADLAQKTLETVKVEFEEIFEERQQKFKELVKKCEGALAERQNRFEAMCEQTKREALAAQERVQQQLKGGRGSTPRRQGVNAETQTDAGGLSSARSSLNATAPPLLGGGHSHEWIEGDLSATTPLPTSRRDEGLSPLELQLSARGGKRRGPGSHGGAFPAPLGLPGSAPASRTVSRLGAMLASAGPRSASATPADVPPLDEAAWLVRREQIGSKQPHRMRGR